MPTTNALTPVQMNTILQEKFQDVVGLGFTAEGINKISRVQSRSVTTFTRTAEALSLNKPLIEGVLESCRGFNAKGIERMLSQTGNGCANVIQKLHSRRADINELIVRGGFAASSISSITRGSEAGSIAGIEALSNYKEALLGVMENGFSASNIASMLANSCVKLNQSIQVLVDNQEKLQGLKEAGFSADNISSMLHSSGLKLKESIHGLVNHQANLLGLMEKGFSPSNISSMLTNSGKNLKDSLQTLVDNQEKLQTLIKNGFSPTAISAMLSGSGGRLGKSIQTLVEHSSLLLDLIQLRECSTKEIRVELRKSGSTLSDAFLNSLGISRATEGVVLNQQSFLADGFLEDLSDLMFGDQTDIQGIVGPGLAALVHHKDKLLQLKQVCGFSANNIAGMLKGGEADMGTSIDELSRITVMLFGLIKEGRFTADELAEKLHGSGVHIAGVFEKHPDIREALHASLRDGGLNTPVSAQRNASPQEDTSLDSVKFFEADDSDVSLLSFDSSDSIFTDSASKRPRFN